MLRRHLHTIELDRENPDLANYDACFYGMLAAKEPMIVNGGFVWEEKNFEREDDKRRARLCFEEMRAVEHEFLRVPTDEKMAWIEAFEWKW